MTTMRPRRRTSRPASPIDRAGADHIENAVKRSFALGASVPKSRRAFGEAGLAHRLRPVSTTCTSLPSRTRHWTTIRPMPPAPITTTRWPGTHGRPVDGSHRGHGGAGDEPGFGLRRIPAGTRKRFSARTTEELGEPAVPRHAENAGDCPRTGRGRRRSRRGSGRRRRRDRAPPASPTAEPGHPSPRRRDSAGWLMTQDMRQCAAGRRGRPSCADRFGICRNRRCARSPPRARLGAGTSASTSGDRFSRVPQPIVRFHRDARSVTTCSHI